MKKTLILIVMLVASIGITGAFAQGNVVPYADDTYDLGTSAKQWQDAYIDGILYADTINADAIDAETATEMTIGAATATGVTIGATDADTTIAGDMIIGSGNIKTDAGDALDITPTPDSGTGAGNALTMAGSAATTTGAGGATSLTGGAAAGAGAAGGAATFAGGAGAGTGNGGAASLTGGVGGAGVQGDGGAATLAGGTGGADGDGGAVNITAGDAGGGDEDGGSVTITAGENNGSGADGDLSIVASTAGALNLQAAAITATDVAGTGAGKITSVSGQALTIEANGAALNVGTADATSVSIGASDIVTTVNGALLAPVYRAVVINHTVVTNTLVVADGSVITADTTGGPVVLTLPDANTVLGATYTIILVTDGGDDLTVERAGADVFNASNNTLLTFADAEDTIVMTAISANRWLITVNIGSVTPSS